MSLRVVTLPGGSVLVLCGEHILKTFTGEYAAVHAQTYVGRYDRQELRTIKRLRERSVLQMVADVLLPLGYVVLVTGESTAYAMHGQQVLEGYGGVFAKERAAAHILRYEIERLHGQLQQLEERCLTQENENAQ